MESVLGGRGKLSRGEEVTLLNRGIQKTSSIDVLNHTHDLL